MGITVVFKSSQGNQAKGIFKNIQNDKRKDSNRPNG